MLAQKVVPVVEIRLDGGALRLAAHIARRNECVPAQPAAVVPRHVEPGVAAAKLDRVGTQPVDERDVRLCRSRIVAALLDPAVPWTHVLANVAPVDLGVETRAVRLGDGGRRLRPVGEAARRVENAGLVERAGRARVDAEPARTAVEVERRRVLQLGVGHERAEHDPGAVAARDQQRVLAVEADAAARRSLAVDVLVRVDEHPVGAADPASELVELLPQRRVAVEPRVPRQAPVTGGPLGLGRVVAESGRDDGARSGQQRLRVTGLLRPRHGEAHVGEQAARAALADVALGLRIRHGRRGPDRVEPQLIRELPEMGDLHGDSLPTVQAVRIHADGGPEVLELEEVPDPAPGEGEILVRIRASALNHLDVWIRKGLPSVPKPRILGADGAGLVEALGAGVTGFEVGQEVVLNPGIEAPDGAIHVIGEHGDGTNAELIAVPATNVYPLPAGLSFEEAAAFPLVFETAYRMLVTRAHLLENEWVLLWGIGSGVSTAGLAIAHALGARTIVTSSSTDKLIRARALGADVTVNHATGDVKAAVKEATGGRGADIVIDHVGEATWRTSLDVAARDGRIAVCGATTGPNPPAALHRIWWKQLTILGSTMGTKADFEGAYALIDSGRARPVVDEVLPLSEIRAAHERLEAGEQLGKIVLSVP
jgi:NADPH:quinone reductase-like Zn-dependent oxidoreductase